MVLTLCDMRGAKNRNRHLPRGAARSEREACTWPTGGGWAFCARPPKASPVFRLNGGEPREVRAAGERSEPPAAMKPGACPEAAAAQAPRNPETMPGDPARVLCGKGRQATGGQTVNLFLLAVHRRRRASAFTMFLNHDGDKKRTGRFASSGWLKKITQATNG